MYRAALLLVLLLPAVAHAQVDGLHATHSIAFDGTAYTFTLTFTDAPDFVTTDEFGRAKDAFGFNIAFDHTLTYYQPNLYSNVALRSTSDGLEILDVDNEAPSWSLRSKVPLQVTGSTVVFSIPFDVLGDPDGRFSYTWLVARYGGMSQDGYGTFLGAPTSAASLSWGSLKRRYR